MSSHTGVRRLHLAVCLILILASLNLQAQRPAGADAASELWGTLAVPGGGPSLLQAAGAHGAADDWRSIPLLIELSYGTPDGLRYTRHIQQYAATLQRFQRQAASIAPDGVLSLNMPAADKRRGDFENLLETLGLAFDRRARRVRLRTGSGDQERAATLERAGLPLDAIVERLNTGDSVSLATSDLSVPLPLGLAFWAARFDPAPPARDLVWAILASREMSCLYYGLLALDNETLTAVRSDARLTTALVRGATVLPVAATALRIEQGRILPAGGSETALLWEKLVGKTLDRPADFVNELLGADNGRLAYFYSTIDALPKGARLFVAGDPGMDLGARRERFQRLYVSFRDALGQWRADALMPPPVLGPADVLFALDTRADGTLTGPPWRDFWSRAFDSTDWPAQPARIAKGIDVKRLLEPADVVQAVCPDRTCREDRLGAFMLLQRESPEASPEDVPALLVAARTRLRYPTLALTIERMRLDDPAAYGLLGGLVSRVEQLGQPFQAVAVVQLQSAASLLSRLRLVGVPGSLVRDHVAELAALPVSNGFNGGLARWLTTRVFVAREGEDADAAAIRLLSGPQQERAGPLVAWESLQYRVDPAVTEAVRIRSGLDRFSVNTLATAQGLVGIGDAVSEAVKAGRVDELVKQLEAAVAAAHDVGPVWWTGASVSFERFTDLPRETGNALRRARATDRRRLERASETLWEAADIAAADAMAGLVYAVALEDPDNAYALSRDLPRRHHLYGAGFEDRDTSPWVIPADRVLEGKPRHVAGSLLGLEVGVTKLAERRMEGKRPDQEPNISSSLAEGLLRTVALTDIWQLSETEAKAIESARARGSGEVAQWRASKRLDHPLSDAGIDGPRAGWIRWSVARGQFEPSSLRGEDLIRLGGLPSSTAAAAGAAMNPGTCLCLSMPSASWERRGQPRDPRLAAAAIVEPVLRVLRELSERGLPVALAPGVLALLTTDLIEHTRLPHTFDVQALLAAVGRVPSVRFDDYIAAVAARGPMVPVTASNESSTR